ARPPSPAWAASTYFIRTESETMATDTPKRQTIVAPIGQSRKYERKAPSTETAKAITQAQASFAFPLRPRSVAHTMGTIRYENTASTPETLTDVVTTRPKAV